LKTAARGMMLFVRVITLRAVFFCFFIRPSHLRELRQTGAGVILFLRFLPRNRIIREKKQQEEVNKPWRAGRSRHSIL
jgi:hypothetical protein